MPGRRDQQRAPEPDGSVRRLHGRRSGALHPRGQERPRQEGLLGPRRGLARLRPRRQSRLLALHRRALAVRPQRPQRHAAHALPRERRRHVHERLRLGGPADDRRPRGGRHAVAARLRQRRLRPRRRRLRRDDLRRLRPRGEPGVALRRDEVLQRRSCVGHRLRQPHGLQRRPVLALLLLEQPRIAVQPRASRGGDELLRLLPAGQPGVSLHAVPRVAALGSGHVRGRVGPRRQQLQLRVRGRRRRRAARPRQRHDRPRRRRPVRGPDRDHPEPGQPRARRSGVHAPGQPADDYGLYIPASGYYWRSRRRHPR